MNGISCFWVCRFVKNLTILFCRCLFCCETIALGVLLGLSLAGGAWYGHSQVHVDHCWAWSLEHLFDVEAARGAVAAACGWWKIVPITLFLITWLIGGGILLGVFIGQGVGFWNQVRAGKFRYKAGLAGHYLIFGWEPNCATLLRDVCENRRQLSIFDVLTRRPLFVILSGCAAEEIKGQVNASFKTDVLDKKPFTLVVYNGQYDSSEEFAWLNVERAKRIFVTGDFNEPAHDSRVVSLLARLNRFLGGLQRKGLTQIGCMARIDSHVLCRSLGSIAVEPSNHLHVQFFNFYENWARRIWEDQYNKVRYFPPLDFLSGGTGKKLDLALLVVGFGNMGQSLALRALERSVCYGGRKVNIYAVDANMDRREPAFNAVFDGLCKRFQPTASIALEPAMAVESAEFESLLKELLGKFRQLTIAITLPNPDEALESALHIASITRDTAMILLRQNVYSSDIEECREALAGSYNLHNIFVFGFQDGAGFGELKQPITEINKYKEKCDTMNNPLR